VSVDEISCRKPDTNLCNFQSKENTGKEKNSKAKQALEIIAHAVLAPMWGGMGSNIVALKRPIGPRLQLAKATIDAC